MEPNRTPSTEPTSSPTPFPAFSSDPQLVQPMAQPEATPLAAPEALPTPEHELPVDAPKKKGRKGLKVFLVVLLVLVALAAIGYSVYAWRQNDTNSSAVTAKEKQISVLNGQITELKSEAAKTKESAAVVESTNDSLFQVKELGIGLTLPDSIKDLTYTYVGGDSVTFSTKTLADKDAATTVCITTNLGELSKVTGKYAAGVAGKQLIKQNASYYLVYEAADNNCADTTPAAPAEVQILIDTLKKGTEL